MPKTNKHAEVKPSKYKTSLCQFFLKGEECPYAARCAFAHGEHELQSETRNVEVLKASGLQRLDGVQVPETPEVAAVIAVTAKSPSSLSTNSFTASLISEPETVLPPTSSAVVRQRRRTVMVSLPKHNTRSEVYYSPYSVVRYDPCYTESGHTEYGYQTQQPVLMYQAGGACAPGSSAVATHEAPYCDCRFSATCSSGQPSKYRHNPYGLTGRIPQCA